MNPTYIIRVQLRKLTPGKPTEIIIQKSVDCDDDKAASALYVDLVKQMPQPEKS